MREGVVASPAEALALETVLKPVIQEQAWPRITCNFEVVLGDNSRRFIDFAIVGELSRIAIEIDGYGYHAEGVISRASFNDQQARQNELVLAGWRILRFTFDQVRNDPYRCQDQLRRMIIDDASLHRNFAPSALAPTTLQQETLNKLESCRADGFTRGLVALPTGTGKTILAAMDANRIGGRILFIAHTNEILQQASRAFARVIPDATIGYIHSEEEHGADRDMVFANIASLRRADLLARLEPDAFTYVVVDEFHHGAAPSYLPVLRHFTPKFMLGLTATPSRTDRKDLLDLLQGNLVHLVSTSEAIHRGFLVPFIYHGLKDNIDYRGIKHNGFSYSLTDLERALLIPKRDEAVIVKYRELAPHAKAIGFCVSIKHANRMAEAFTRYGIPSVSIHSDLSKEERRERMAKFVRGDALCAFTRDLFNEGVDVPETEALLFLRPTESRIVMTQQLGRGLRIAPRKKAVVVLDFIGNYRGVKDVPGYLQSLADPNRESTSPHHGKPEFIYENGCQILFEQEVLEHFSFSSAHAIDTTRFLGQIAERSDLLDRPLSPLDLFNLLGNALGEVVASHDTYGAFVDRMNRLSGDPSVVDEEFRELDVRRITEFAADIEGLSGMAAAAMDVLDRLQVIMSSPPLKRTRKMMVEWVWDVYELCEELVRVLAPLCLIHQNIHSMAEEIPLKVGHTLEDVGSCEEFFIFVARESVRRDSFSQINSLRVMSREVFHMPRWIAKQDDPQLAAVVALNRLLERKGLTWIASLMDLCSFRSIDL